MGSRTSGRWGRGDTTRYEDLTGRKFGRWTVLERGEDNDWKQMTYVCLCECGFKGRVLARSLRNGQSKSCSCLANEQTSERMKRQWQDGTFKPDHYRKPRKKRRTYEAWK